MEINYSSHRMTNYDWIRTYSSSLGMSSFSLFRDRVYSRLMKLQSGEVYDLKQKVSEANRDLFIKCACLFISEGNSDYSFSDDYTLIYKK